MTVTSNLLSLIAFSPLIGIIILLFINKQKAGVIKGIGIAVTLIPLVLALVLFAGFDFDKQGYQYEESIKWIEFPIEVSDHQFMQINYELGVDGLAVSLIVLTAIIGTLAAIASIYIKKRWKEYFILFFLLQVGMFGVFMSKNLFLFFIFFELTVIPMYFLIGIWGYVKRESAANNFLIYNGIGSAVMLIAFVALFMNTGTVDILALQMHVANPVFLSEGFKLGVFIALLFAFGVKLPIFLCTRGCLKYTLRHHQR